MGALLGEPPRSAVGVFVCMFVCVCVCLYVIDLKSGSIINQCLMTAWALLCKPRCCAVGVCVCSCLCMCCMGAVVQTSMLCSRRVRVYVCVCD